MQKELKDLQPVLEKTAVEVEEMMVQIDADKAAAAETKASVQKQEAAANEKAAQAKAIADDAQVCSLSMNALMLAWQCSPVAFFRISPQLKDYVSRPILFRRALLCLAQEVHSVIARESCAEVFFAVFYNCLLYTSPSPRD